MAHNTSHEKQERQDRQITVLQSIEQGWRAELWCPGCEVWRVAPYSAIIGASMLEFAWPRAMRKMRCPTCRMKPAMISLKFGPRLVVMLKASTIG